MDILEKNLITAFALDKLPAEERDAALEKLSQAIFHTILLRALEEMDEAKQNELDAFLEAHAADPDALFNFLDANVPNLNDIIAEEIASFRRGAEEVAAVLPPSTGE